MVFNSSIFLLYFLPASLIVYYLLDKRFRNIFLLLLSIFFYSWGAPKFVFVIIVSVLADFLVIRKMASSEGSLRKFLFWSSVILNLGILLYFKYMNFFYDQFAFVLKAIGSKPGTWTQMIMPLGISFITFQKLAYTFDVKKNVSPPFRKIQDYALYIFMFPQLLSGPILRPGQISGQITNRVENETTDIRLTGFYRFMIGLAKKVLIADVLAVYVNQVFSLGPMQLSSGLAWMGAFAYTFQVYFDFSGYTDMALGLGLLLGFRLPENFNNPYISGSITEFWKRWHMTLSSWLRDYLFLPLAYSTSRALPKEKYLNLRTDKVIYLIATSVTFLLCGFWHGAAWTFILWGAYQGVFLIFDRLFLLKFFKKTGKIPARIITFFIIVIGWVLFRSESLDYFHFYIRRMFSFVTAKSDVWLDPKFWTMLCIAIIFSFWGKFTGIENWQKKLFTKPGNIELIIFTILAILLFILCEATISSSGFSPFIYFRF
jgi:alginate O-acetyltransferase complex protein AlgI